MLIKRESLSASEEQTLEGGLGSPDDAGFDGDNENIPNWPPCPVCPSLLLPLSSRSQATL